MADDLPVDPAVDPEVPQPEPVTNEEPTPQQDGNTSGYGEANEPAVPTADVKTEANPVSPSPASGQIAYDDEGNLLPGYTLDEDNNPVFVGGDFVEPATQALANAGRTAAGFAAGIRSLVKNAQGQANNTAAAQMPVNTDWRVTLRLAPGSNYLYNAPQPGLLAPLKVTNGVIFPYTPSITTAYKADYAPYDLTHSNYRGYFYKSSYTDQINITEIGRAHV